MIQADARALPLASNTADLVISSPPFQAPFLAQAKAEMARILKPGRPALLLQMKVRPKAWWWLVRGDEERCLGPGRVLPPLVLPGWQRLPPDDVAKLIRTWSDPGDLVCDPFAGSGTVERVAEQEGRRGVSLDLFPAFPREWLTDPPTIARLQNT